jgi:lipopolysaccharide biosynthesis glycosyltransferase
MIQTEIPELLADPELLKFPKIPPIPPIHQIRLFQIYLQFQKYQKYQKSQKYPTIHLFPKILMNPMYHLIQNILHYLILLHQDPLM